MNKRKKQALKVCFLFLCTPAEARTLDTLIKSQVLYQLSYGCILFLKAGAKVLTFYDITKLFAEYFLKKVLFIIMLILVNIQVPPY